MKPLFVYIASHSFYGIPLDIIAHLMVGAALFWGVRKVGVSRRRSLALVALAAVTKELTYDLHVWMTYGFYFEPIKDIAVSVLVPALFMLRSSQNRKLLTIKEFPRNPGI